MIFIGFINFFHLPYIFFGMGTYFLIHDLYDCIKKCFCLSLVFDHLGGGAAYENLRQVILRPKRSFTAWRCACFFVSLK